MMWGLKKIKMKREREKEDRCNLHKCNFPRYGYVFAYF